jgi:8-oxo-dGTP pyrophosphatase MutT (NUDIX family)
MKGASGLAASDIQVVPVERLDLAFAPLPWQFAQQRRADIDAYFARLRHEKPALWNGRVLLLRHFAIEGAVFRGAYFDTDFASFLAWRDWDFPDRTVHNCFAMGALRSGDGAFILGRMNAHTANAGLVYFPGGTPDLSDVVAGTVDLTGSALRELNEETGLTEEDFAAEPGWYTVLAGPRIAQLKVLQAAERADVLRARILDHLARERQPELADICIVREPSDFDAQMPQFIKAFIEHIWAAPSGGSGAGIGGR